MVIETLLYYLFETHRIKFYSLMHISAFSCYSSYMINRLCAALCSWLITCLTFIRFINIFHQFHTIKSNIILLISLFLILSLVNSYSIIVLEYRIGDSHTIDETRLNYTHDKHLELLNHQAVCNIREEYADNRSILLINILVAGLFNLALPSILILIVNITTLCLIKRVYSRRTCEKKQRRSDVIIYRSTLLVISITYTLFYIQYLIFYFLVILLEDPEGILFKMSEVAFILRHVSHSINFYAYIFTDRRFRQEIIVLLRFLCRPCSYFREQRHYQHEQKIRIILIDKHRLPPPLPMLYRNSMSKNAPQNPINLKQQEEVIL